MKKPRPSFFNRLFCLLMALYVLNFSVDPPDGYVRKTIYCEEKEDLRVNEMESVGEWVLEKLLGIKNAVPEHDETPDESSQVTKAFVGWVAPGVPLSFLLPPVATVTHPTLYAFCAPVFISHHAEVTAPPPWRC